MGSQKLIVPINALSRENARIRLLYFGETLKYYQVLTEGKRERVPMKRRKKERSPELTLTFMYLTKRERVISDSGFGYSTESRVFGRFCTKVMVFFANLKRIMDFNT